jgi:hypothetical protein
MNLADVVTAILAQARFDPTVNGYVVPVELVWELRRIMGGAQ